MTTNDQATDAAELFSIRGRVAVITGASSGIGVAMARGLAKAGARVVLAARRRELLQALADELEKEGAEAHVVVTDVSDEASVDALVATTVERCGGADVLVNNAGITVVVPAEEEAIADFDAVVNVNLRGVFLCAQRFGRVMLEAGRGSIVNVASVLGLVGTGQVPQAGYAAAKGGVVNLTRELGAQWARRGVRVNGIAPGWFRSEMTEDMFSQDTGKRWISRNTPMGRPGEGSELVGAMLFLASDASSYVTGHTIPVDGGWTAV